MIFGIRKWPVIATVIVLVAVAIMVRLGIWQLDRMDEKEALIARYAANQALGSAGELDLQNAGAYLFRTVDLPCPTPSNWDAVAGRNAGGQSGYVQRYRCQQIALASDEDAQPQTSSFLAVVGWSQSPDQVAWDGGVVRGVLAPLGDDFKVVADQPLEGLEATARPDPADMPNNHLAYAGQWFFFALTALVIYVLALRRRQRDRAGRNNPV